LLLDALEQTAEVGNPFACLGRQRPPGLRHPFGTDRCQAQLVKRAGQSPGKAWHQRDGREVLEIAGGDGIEHRAGRGRFRAGPRAGYPVRSGEPRGAQPCGKLGQAESRQAERRPDPAGDCAREVVRRSARGADDDDLR
jgi:hypothetical protein